MAIRKQIKIAVTPAAKEAVEKFCERNAATEIGIASRVYEWWAAQDDVVRKGVVGMLPEGHEVDVLRLVLDGLAAAAQQKKPTKGK